VGFSFLLEAASLCQEEPDSVAGSAIPHLLTGLSQVILLKFPPSVESLGVVHDSMCAR
jgi:hypothetical protein